MKGILVTRPERCVGCHSCELACAIEHSAAKDLAGAIHESPAPVSRIRVKPGGAHGLPDACRQCGNAPCIAACPCGALYRENRNQPVLANQDLCGGCRSCIEACPFGVIDYDEASETIIKCDVCYDRVKRGGEAACVEACPVAALEALARDDVHYTISREACTGCRACAKKCPVDAIRGEKKQVHVIDQEICVKCGACRDVCRFDAVAIR